jgi:phosphate transport system permease protein
VDVGVIPFLFGDTWAPTATPPLFGILPLVVGTLLVTIGAILFAVPLSIGCAIYVSELASPRVKSVLKPAIELLAGIPSVVYGFFGLIVLTDFIRVTFDIPTGETWLAASVILGIMALPTIISISEDAISAVPHEFRRIAPSGQYGGRPSAGFCRQFLSVLLPSYLHRQAIGDHGSGDGGNAAVIPDPIQCSLL